DEVEGRFTRIDKVTIGAGRAWNGAARYPRGPEIRGPVEALPLEDKQTPPRLCHPPAFSPFCNELPGFPAITRSPGTDVVQRHNELTCVHEYRVRLAPAWAPPPPPPA